MIQQSPAVLFFLRIHAVYENAAHSRDKIEYEIYHAVISYFIIRKPANNRLYKSQYRDQ